MRKITLMVLILFAPFSYAQDIKLSGIISAENNQIKNLADPTETQDAVTKGYLEAQITDLQNQINESENNNSELPGFILAESLIAYYPLNGNANDVSGNELHGEVNGALPSFDRYGNINSSFLFTDNQDITIPSTEEKNLYPLTISLWYRPNTYPTGGNTNIFSKYVADAWNGFQILYGDNTNVPNDGNTENNGFGTQSWYATNQANRVIGYYGSPGFLQSNLTINTWYHYVLVIDSNGGKIYVDGQLVSSDIWDGNPGESTNNYLWKIGGTYGGGGFWYNGKIDDIGIWERAFSQEEVLSLYNGY
jgi:hypothetical protein